MSEFDFDLLTLNMILYPDVHICIGNLNNLYQQKEVIFIDIIIYSSGESLGEVSYEAYSCQILNEMRLLPSKL